MSTRPSVRFMLVVSCVAMLSCSEDNPLRCGTDDAQSRCLTPQFTDAYYVDQGDKYFDTYDTTADPMNTPTYSELVVRWEWPPWLKLTALSRQFIETADPLVQMVTPSTVPQRDCRFFDEQPFVRCRITFMYSGGPCPIYEEFTFNDQGEITWIEAWADMDGFLPFGDPDDLWGEGPDVNRMSTLIPGLGNTNGLIDPNSPAMLEAAAANPDIADFQMRARSQQAFTSTWLREFNQLGAMSEYEIYGEGCGWDPPAP